MVSRIREGYSSDKYRNIYNSYRMVFASIGEKMHDWLEWFMWHGCESSKFLESSFRCLLESRRQFSKGHPNQQFLKGSHSGWLQQLNRSASACGAPGATDHPLLCGLSDRNRRRDSDGHYPPR